MPRKRARESGDGGSPSRSDGDQGSRPRARARQGRVNRDAVDDALRIAAERKLLDEAIAAKAAALQRAKAEADACEAGRDADALMIEAADSWAQLGDVLRTHAARLLGLPADTSGATPGAYPMQRCGGGLLVQADAGDPAECVFATVLGCGGGVGESPRPLGGGKQHADVGGAAARERLTRQIVERLLQQDLQPPEIIRRMCKQLSASRANELLRRLSESAASATEYAESDGWELALSEATSFAAQHLPQWNGLLTHEQVPEAQRSEPPAKRMRADSVNSSDEDAEEEADSLLDALLAAVQPRYNVHTVKDAEDVEPCRGPTSKRCSYVDGVDVEVCLTRGEDAASEQVRRKSSAATASDFVSAAATVSQTKTASMDILKPTADVLRRGLNQHPQNATLWRKYADVAMKFSAAIVGAASLSVRLGCERSVLGSLDGCEPPIWSIEFCEGVLAGTGAGADDLPPGPSSSMPVWEAATDLCSSSDSRGRALACVLHASALCTDSCVVGRSASAGARGACRALTEAIRALVKVNGPWSQHPCRRKRGSCGVDPVLSRHLLAVLWVHALLLCRVGARKAAAWLLWKTLFLHSDAVSPRLTPQHHLNGAVLCLCLAVGSVPGSSADLRSLLDEPLGIPPMAFGTQEEPVQELLQRWASETEAIVERAETEESRATLSRQRALVCQSVGVHGCRISDASAGFDSQTLYDLHSGRGRDAAAVLDAWAEDEASGGGICVAKWESCRDASETYPPLRTAEAWVLWLLREAARIDGRVCVRTGFVVAQSAVAAQDDLWPRTLLAVNHAAFCRHAQMSSVPALVPLVPSPLCRGAWEWTRPWALPRVATAVLRDDPARAAEVAAMHRSAAELPGVRLLLCIDRMREAAERDSPEMAVESLAAFLADYPMPTAVPSSGLIVVPYRRLCVSRIVSL